mgnify:CR=1 FL=1
MNPKIEKYRQEREKNKEKISRLQARNRILDAKILELENTEIVGMVRTQGMNLEEFASMLQALKAPNITPVKEDSADEEE